MTENREKLARDIVWNVASLGVAGVFGIAMNYVIGVVYGAAALGVFNQVYAIYIVVSQIAVLGVHTSVLYHVAGDHDVEERRATLVSALVITVGLAVATTALFVAIAGPFARLLDSPDVETGMWWAAPGLACFALDKVVLAAVNAVQRMRAYAIFYAGRFVVMGVALAGCVLAHARASSLPVILSIGEVVVLAGATWTMRDHLRLPPIAAMRRWWRTHLAFGTRGFLSGLFSGLNNRIDILVLGALAADSVVGAYSFAALIAEGLFQILIALRTTYAPIVVRLLARGERDELGRILRRTRDRTYLGAVVFGALAAAGYALVVPRITHDPALQRSWIYFAILTAGMVAAAGYAPFNQLLLWAGRPGWHTVMNVIMVATSAAACAVLVLIWGATGAATAVAASYASSVALLKVMTSKILDLKV